jgi:dihydroorotate dehydrogenase
MKNRILERFSLVQIVTDEGILKRMKFPSPAYEKALADIEKQYGRIMVGLGRMDECENEDDFWDVADTFIEILEVDLANAHASWGRALCEQLAECIAKPKPKAKRGR